MQGHFKYLRASTICMMFLLSDPFSSNYYSLCPGSLAPYEQHSAFSQIAGGMLTCHSAQLVIVKERFQALCNILSKITPKLISICLPIQVYQFLQGMCLYSRCSNMRLTSKLYTGNALHSAYKVHVVDTTAIEWLSGRFQPQHWRGTLFEQL